MGSLLDDSIFGNHPGVLHGITSPQRLRMKLSILVVFWRGDVLLSIGTWIRSLTNSNAKLSTIEIRRCSSVSMPQIESTEPAFAISMVMSCLSILAWESDKVQIKYCKLHIVTAIKVSRQLFFGFRIHEFGWGRVLYYIRKITVWPNGLITYTSMLNLDNHVISSQHRRSPAINPMFFMFSYLINGWEWSLTSSLFFEEEMFFFLSVLGSGL